MIALSPTTSSTDIAIIREIAGDNIINGEARASKTKCLDGTTAVTHSGVSVGDEELKVKSRPSEAELVILERLWRSHTDLTISTSTGLYSGFIYTFKFNGDILTMTLWKTARLDV